MAPLEKDALRPYLVVVGLMALTSLALALSVDVHVTDEAGVRLELPDQVGEWSGQEMRFCQNPVCQREFMVKDLRDPAVCRECGGATDSMTIAERDLLPADTRMLKKRYAHPAGRAVFTSIVLSGKERASIHRPEVCLVGQGREITGKRVVAVPVEGRAPLKVMVLELTITHPRRADGRTVQSHSYYAYWFAGKDRETPYHSMRMFWMGADRVLRNVAHRWAYISVAGIRDPDADGYLDEVREMAGLLYPHMALERS